jgi:PAS domain-containing protein
MTSHKGLPESHMEKKKRKGQTPPTVDVAEIMQTEEALHAALAREAWLARFPRENPNPVVRASAEGTILYCNPAAIKNDEWVCKEGKPPRDQILQHVAPAMAKGEETYTVLKTGKPHHWEWTGPDDRD